MIKTKKTRNQTGQAAILLIFALGLIIVLIGLSLIKTGTLESLMSRSEIGSTKAFYIANAGVEKAYSLIKNDTYTSPFPLNLESGSAQVSVTDNGNRKIIESRGTTQGTSANFTRKLIVTLQKTSGLDYAVHAGSGGFELDVNSLITGKNGASGNVYSNGDIMGKSSAHSDGHCIKNKENEAGSVIEGSVTAVGNIIKYKGGDGVCVEQSLSANDLKECYVVGLRSGVNIDNDNCPSAAIEPPVILNTPPPVIKLPLMGEDEVIADIKTTPFPNDCTLGGHITSEDCSFGSNKIGPLIIKGGLTIESNTNVIFSGPVYIQGNLTIKSHVNISMDQTNPACISQMIITTGSISIASYVNIGNQSCDPSGKAFLLFISKQVASGSDICQDPTISLSSNTDTVLFYTNDGCINIASKLDVHGTILGKKIHVSSNSTIEYDPDLKFADFGPQQEGDWQTLSFKEE
ncbi:MAG: pilus assembly PilX N-terminal domain-containing protein [Candidatus Gottesmanbacteria bacterium]